MKPRTGRSLPLFTPALAAAVLVLVVGFSFGGSFKGVFVFDDVPAIVENPTLREPANLLRVLAPPGEQAGTVGGRPVVNLTLAWNYAISGLETWSYHAVNLAIHLAAALLLLGIVRRTLRQCGLPPSNALLIAFVATALWATHPLQTESVTYIVQRAESLMGLFYFLVLYCFIRAVELERDASALPAKAARRWRAACILACGLGMATKEVMATAPLMVLLYDRTFVSASWSEAWRRHRSLYGKLAATWGILLLLVASTHGRGGTAGFATSVGLWSYGLTQCKAVCHYLGQALWPDHLVFDYGPGLTRYASDVAGQMLLLAILLVGTGWALRRRPALGFLALAFFVLLAPSSSIVPIATEPIAEHRMYLPLAAMAVLVAMTVHAGLTRISPRWGRVAFGGLGVVGTVALSAATITRNRDYRSEVALWTATVRNAPENPRAHNNLAEALLAGGQSSAAQNEFAAAVAIDQSYSPAQYNFGVMLLDTGHAAEAVVHLEKALSAPRHQAEVHLYLGEAYEQTERTTDALQQYREALRLAPNNAEAAFGLGNCLAAAGRYDEAIQAFRVAVAAAPDQVRIRNNLANALMFSGQVGEAIVEYREALKRDPENTALRTNLALALGNNAAKPELRNTAQP